MKFTKKDFTSSQLKLFEKENDEWKEAILRAMNRKEIVRTLGCGKLFIKYNYDKGEYGFGELSVKARIEDNKGKILWKAEILDAEGYDGEEPITLLVDTVLEHLMSDLCDYSDYDDYADDDSNLKLFKRILGYGR